MSRMGKSGIALAIAALITGTAWMGTVQFASANGSSEDDTFETIWQVGIFDGLKHEFGFEFLDEDFVCDNPPEDGPGVQDVFEVGVTPVDSFPGTISSLDAPQDDERFEHSCNSVTIAFEIPDGVYYEDLILKYSRMGGEADTVSVDGDIIGVTGELEEDPSPSELYEFNISDMGPGPHTVSVMGLFRTECNSGITCHDGLSDGFHFVDAISLSGERQVDEDDTDVLIDVKPGNQFNVINPRSHGKITVAILGSDSFDAEDVDADSTRFGPDRAHPAHNPVVIMDVNDDGHSDMVLHFETDETGIECGDDSVVLIGETNDGDGFSGSDSIVTVGCVNVFDRDDDDVFENISYNPGRWIVGPNFIFGPSRGNAGLYWWTVAYPGSPFAAFDDEDDSYSYRDDDGSGNGNSGRGNPFNDYDDSDDDDGNRGNGRGRGNN